MQKWRKEDAARRIPMSTNYIVITSVERFCSASDDLNNESVSPAKIFQAISGETTPTGTALFHRRYHISDSYPILIRSFSALWEPINKPDAFLN